MDNALLALGLSNPSFEGHGVFACESAHGLTSSLHEGWSTATALLGGLFFLLRALLVRPLRARAMYVLLAVSAAAAAQMHAFRSLRLGPLVQLPIALYALLLIDTAARLVLPRAGRAAAGLAACAVLSRAGVFSSKETFLPAAAVLLAAGGALLAVAARSRHAGRLAALAALAVAHAALFLAARPTTEEECGWAGAAAEYAHAAEHADDFLIQHLTIGLVAAVLEEEKDEEQKREKKKRL